MTDKKCGTTDINVVASSNSYMCAGNNINNNDGDIYLKSNIQKCSIDDMIWYIHWISMMAFIDHRAMCRNTAGITFSLCGHADLGSAPKSVFLISKSVADLHD